MVDRSETFNEVLSVWEAELAAKPSNLRSVFVAYEDQIKIV